MTEWAYGVTTCPQRLTTLLPRTLESLTRAGFDQPRLFIDGPGIVQGTLPVTQRDSSVGAFGSWVLAAWELYVRQPKARLYALFQDDVVLCLGVREYLEQTVANHDGYMNLFTFATNENLVFGKPKGWLPSDQLGKGAVALVFPHEAMVALLKQEHLVNKPQLSNGHKNLDGAIQHALVVGAKMKEYIHNPSLAQHTGREGTLGNHQHPDAKTFPGEQYDAMGILR
jgi:hypothetical protein